MNNAPLQPGDIPAERIQKVYQIFMKSLSEGEEEQAAFHISLLLAAGESLEMIRQHVINASFPKEVLEDLLADGEVTVDELRLSVQETLEDILSRHPSANKKG